MCKPDGLCGTDSFGGRDLISLLNAVTAKAGATFPMKIIKSSILKRYLLTQNNKQMKKLLLLAMVLIVHNAWSNTDTIKVKSVISSATVFYEGAQLTRKAELTAPKGKHLLVLEKLTPEINPQSIQVSGMDGCKIQSVKHQLSYPAPNNKEKAEIELDAKIAAQEQQIKEVRNKMSVADIEERLLLENSQLTHGKEGVQIAVIKEAADFFRLRLNEIRHAKLLMAAELDNANKLLQELNAKLNEISVNRRKTYSEVLIAVECSKDVKSSFEMSYLVNSAGWIPSYDFRVDDITQPLSIVYNASVFQTSGENWNNVNMKLSTSNPMLNGTKPELPVWYLGSSPSTGNKGVVKGTGTLKGRVLEAVTGEPVAFASVVAEYNNVVIGATTDFDGQYTIKPIRPGNYVVKVTFVGYEPSTALNVGVIADRISTRDFQLKASSISLSEVELIDYKVPSRTKSTSTSGYAVAADNSLPPLSALVGGKQTGYDNEKTARMNNGQYYNKQGDAAITTNIISNSLRTNLTNIEYAIEIPYTIPSDGQDYAIKIKEVSLPVNYVYYAVPKLESDVFLTAEISGWEQLNLQSGKSGIYYQGTFTGESYLDTDVAADTLKMSLGRDNGIVVQRQSNKEMIDRQFFGNTITETIGWDITVKNNKSTTVKVVVEDQFPISEKKSIEVEWNSYAGAKLDSKTGKLTWEIELSPSEKKVLNFKYIVRYPRSTSFVLE